MSSICPTRYGAVVLAALCILSGCNGLVGPTGTATPSRTPGEATAAPATPGGSTPSTTTERSPASATPAADRLGWEAGYAATDPLPVNASDGLNATELNATVARTMARVELIRGLEFEEPVAAEVVSRETFRERNVRFVERRDPRVTEAFWEALFLVGEDENATGAIESVFGGGVVGYYADDRIVLVSDDASPRVDTGTLAHELVHALQDQQFGGVDRGETFDARVGTQGLTEGDPVAVERAYRERCTGEWSCLSRPRPSSDAGAIARHPGVYLAFVQPYATGPAFVEALRERSGNWTAVNEAYADPPRASEQVIHPGAYPDERPVNVTVPNRSGSNWTHIGNDTMGEGGIHVMFWANGLVPRGDDSVSTDYEHPRSAGWDGDTLVVYEETRDPDADAGGEGEMAYVWRTVWENGTEAQEFQRSYRAMLLVRHGAREVAPGTYHTGNGTFGDAFRVVRRNETVTVVNAPTVEALPEVHAS
ncbi:Hvo_1808 family surface protein [Salinirubellus sp. GCM10025818]|uniref:Hvo_1808 family surface protein n=1 Tax=Salinirubellus TaxID=2162630 RepID=UPI0030D384DB